MALISLRKVQLGFGGAPLLDAVDLTLEPGERVCLLGRNGVGKSSLMKLIAGDLHADDGQISVRQGACIARLTQEIDQSVSGTVFDVVSAGLGELGGLVRRYHQLSLELAADQSEAALQRLARVQQQLEAAHGWQTEQRVETAISRLSLDAEADFASLSGGLKRRVLLASALVPGPDLLLLDEPTNHLDIASIDWLEEFLLGFEGALLFVTHDRVFLQRLATRIIELDRGVLTDWPGDYANYLRRKDEQLSAEARANQRFDKKLAQEEVWIRQGIKARRTRNEGRVRELEAMRAQRARRRQQTGQAKMALQEADRSGRLVAEAVDLTYTWRDAPVIAGFSTTIMRGDRVGIIGPNGVGKSTLLNLLLGRLRPDSGSLRLGTRLQIAYFDQLRAALAEELSVQENVADGSDKVQIEGRSKHVLSYLQDFLFTPDRARQPVKTLSGGERNRLLLARLFARPANVLVMDEPTNDLDLETLELLEDLLLQYQGTLLLVSHDRAFLNNVVTSTLVFEGDARVTDYVGGYDDWLRQRPPPAARPESARRRARSVRSNRLATKLSYKDQRELDALPQRIEQLEQELASLQATMADPGFFRLQGGEIAAAKASLAAAESALAEAYQRWESLEAQRGQG